MLSRVADNLYWMARYLERAQHTARLLDVTLDLVPDRSAGAVTRSWEKVFASLHLAIPEGLPMKGRPITQMLALDAESDPSIVHHIASARDNARQVRELISTEMWEQINRLYLDLQNASMDRVWAAPHEFFHAVKQGAHLFQGITDSTMDRGEGWHFIQLGQYVEAYLPGLCWRGFDPTNNLVVGERHIRVAAGRDYADVPPSRGVFKGLAASELGVSVSVTPSPIPITPEGQVLLSTLTAPAPRPSRRIDQQQQQ